MKLNRRIFINISRFKGRSTSLMVAVAILGFLVASSLLVIQAFGMTTQQLQRSLPIVMSTVLESDELEEERLTRELVHEIGNLPYVSRFDYTMWDGVRSYDHHPYWLEYLDNSFWEGSDFHRFEVLGVSRPEIIYVESGMYELSEGRLFTADEVAPDGISLIAPLLVSREFAERNGLSVNSIIELQSFVPVFQLPEGAVVPEGGFTGLNDEEIWSHPYFNHESVAYSFQIVGIFEITRVLRPNDPAIQEHQQLVNMFITPNWRIHQMQSDLASGMERRTQVFGTEQEVAEAFRWRSHTIVPLWVLEDLDSIEPFMESADRILPSHYRLDEGLSGIFRPMIEATNNLNGLFNQILWISSGGMIMVLSLLILIFLRERKQEFGIYLALGERKPKMILQIITEVVAVSLVGLSLGLIVANFSVEALTTNMLQEELENASRPIMQDMSFIERVGFGQELTPEEMLEFFTVSLDGRTIITFFWVALGVITLSTIVPVTYILDMNPKEILVQSKIQ
ncbi:MAG: ABC transporter permease [Turicibacter sp.]|nr:ABC transporter permease [Turicibacter sp.]